MKLIESNVIQNGKKEHAEGIKYDFTLGDEILKASFKIPVKLSEVDPIDRAKFTVDPGEIVFVLTEERLILPPDIYIVLIPKRKLNHEGIMILGGLSVDPYYEGKLLLGIYNFSSSPFNLRPGKKIIGAHFYRLREDELNADLQKPEAAIDDFPEQLVQLMGKYTPISTQSLLEKITSIDFRLEEFKKDFNKTESWFKEFQSKLDKQEKLVEELLVGLQNETRNRLDSDKEIKDDVKTYRDELTKHSNRSYKNWVWISIISTIVTGVLVGSIVFVIQLSMRPAQKNETPPSQIQPQINITIDSSVLKKINK